MFVVFLKRSNHILVLVQFTLSEILLSKLMTTEQSSTGKDEDPSSTSLPVNSESPSRKRLRRSKQQDPQFIFDNPTVDETAINTASTANANKRTPTKPKIKSLQSVDSVDTSADLYEPGDIVWCKLGGFPWWPALIVGVHWFHTTTLLFFYLVSMRSGRWNTHQDIEYVQDLWILVCICLFLDSNNKPKRLFFVYFYGKYLEYSWISTRWLLNYAGLSNFIQHAEAAVQQVNILEKHFSSNHFAHLSGCNEIWTTRISQPVSIKSVDEETCSMVSGWDSNDRQRCCFSFH